MCEVNCHYDGSTLLWPDYSYIIRCTIAATSPRLIPDSPIFWHASADSRIAEWNKIEHRMFSHITQNWRGRPLLSHQVMVKLIGNTKTKTGLKLKAKLDNANYETGRKIKNDEFMKIKLEPSGFHGEWNYKISSNKS